MDKSAIIQLIVFLLYLAFMLAIGVRFFLKGKKAKDADLVANIERYINMSNPNIAHTTTQRIYDPPSSSSSTHGRFCP